MGVLSSPYNPSIYKNTALFRDVVDKSIKANGKSYLAEIGKIFVKHQVHDKYGLVLVHRHFPIDDDELLVETMKDDISLAMPWKINGNKAVPHDMTYFQSHGFSSEEANWSIGPCSWLFEKETGKIQEFEFYASNSSVVAPPQSFPAFVEDLYNKLKENGLEEIYGLRLLNERKEDGGYESTPKGKRCNIVRFDKNRPLNEKFMDASWFFKDNGDAGVTVGCFFICTGFAHYHGDDDDDEYV